MDVFFSGLDDLRRFLLDRDTVLNEDVYPGRFSLQVSTHQNTFSSSLTLQQINQVYLPLCLAFTCE
jgi:hypothetical protein